MYEFYYMYFKTFLWLFTLVISILVFRCLELDYNILQNVSDHLIILSIIH